MPKVKFFYDTEKCRFEPLIVERKAVLLNVLVFLNSALILASCMTYYYQKNFKSFREAHLLKENSSLRMEWDLLQNKINSIEEHVNGLTYNDDHIYRVILDAEPIPSTIRQGGAGGHIKYEDILNNNLQNEELIVGTYETVDQLKKKLYIQTKSYDELQKILGEKEVKWAARPAIQPINNAELIRISSGFNPQRFHPILKKIKPHKGIDFTAPKGTPVYATGDGIVTSAYYSSSYGNVIFLNHGYGYQTRYAHLSGFNIKAGQHVKRGEVIGFVGNTGRSEASHLHYEVLYKFHQTDPINYFQRDLSNDEYEKLIQLSEESKNVILD